MSEALERARGAVARLKVFPLPAVVLLPGTALPLHIFEERYRELLRDALAQDRIFALAQVIPGQEDRLRGRPALEAMLCVGSVAAHSQLEDGRSNLVLVGLARARILREHPQVKGYREVQAEVLEDPAVPLDDPDEVALQAAVVELMARLPTEVAERVAQVTARVRGGALADVVASTVLDDATRRYEVLSELDVRARMRSVAEETMLIVGSMRARRHEGLMN
jgi:Lon protease-like protein